MKFRFCIFAAGEARFLSKFPPKNPKNKNSFNWVHGCHKVLEFFVRDFGYDFVFCICAGGRPGYVANVPRNVKNKSELVTLNS